MLRIKLQRRGKKRAPIYRICVIESSKKMGGEPVEVLGFYNPKTKELIYNVERSKHWVSVGAQPSETVAALLKKDPVHDLANGPYQYKARTIQEKKATWDELYAKKKRPSKKQLAKEKAAKEAKEAPAEEAPAEEAAAEAPAEEAAA